MEKGIYPISKRVFDLALTLLALPLWLPLALVTAFLVGIKLGNPVIFSQQRPGLNGKPFRLYKFRTMTEARDPQGKLLPDDVRLTPFGRLLRALSLDELPEFYNVLRGEMSLVGPRPLLMAYLDRYSAGQMRRHLLPPGITGWAQINGRNILSWEEKFRLDIWYIDHWSLLLDLKILLLTVRKVLLREGISGENQATAEEFKGNSEKNQG